MATKVTDLFEPEEYGNVRIEVTSSPLREREGNRFHRKAYTIALINAETGEPVVGEISRMMPIQAYQLRLHNLQLQITFPCLIAA